MIMGNITKKISFIGNVEVVSIKKKKVHTVFLWVNNKDTIFTFKINNEVHSFTVSDLYNLELSTQKMGVVPRGIPAYVVYDDTNNVYLITYKFEEVVTLDIILEAPSGTNVEYAWQVVADGD